MKTQSEQFNDSVTQLHHAQALAWIARRIWEIGLAELAHQEQERHKLAEEACSVALGFANLCGERRETLRAEVSQADRDTTHAEAFRQQLYDLYDSAQLHLLPVT